MCLGDLSVGMKDQSTARFKSGAGIIGQFSFDTAHLSFGRGTESKNLTVALRAK